MIYGNVENEGTTYAVVACSVSGSADSTNFYSDLGVNTKVDAMFVDFQQTCEEVQSNGFRAVGGVTPTAVLRGSGMEILLTQAFERVPK